MLVHQNGRTATGEKGRRFGNVLKIADSTERAWVMNTKKYLYATTAIIGATAMTTGAQAQGLELNVGGFVNAYYGMIDVDADGVNDETREVAMNEYELRLTGSYTLDNGVEVGAFLSNEMEGETAGANTAEADEQYFYLSGSFGTLQLGQQNGAAYVTNAGGSQAYAAGVPVNSGWGLARDLTGDYDGAFRTPGISTFIDLTDDDNGVVYKSPRLGGFMLAGSWHPDSGTGNGGTTDFFTQVDDSAQQNNAISVGANFSRDFQGIGIDASAGWGTEDRPGQEDPNQYQFSLGASAAGFSFGGSAAFQDDDTANDGESYALGGAYSAGPWTVGLNGIYSEVEGAAVNNNDEDERLAISAGLDYAMGPGVTLGSGINYREFDNEEGTDQDGFGAVLGATVSF
jgi:outer membrane protein OmpU